MRILLATDEYLPHPGGSQRVIQETSRRLQARGHQVAILTLERDLGLPQQDEVAGVPVRRIPLRGRLGTYPQALLGSWRALRERARSYDLLHIHLPLIGPGALQERTARRTPRICSFYGPWHEEMAVELRVKPLPAVARVLYSRYVDLLCYFLQAWQDYVMRRCDRVLALSDYSQQQIAALFPAVNPKRIVLIPGGVDTARFCHAPDQAAVRARLNLPADATVLFTVRRLVPRMGLENLLQAFAQVRQQRDDLYLVIGGRGRLERALQDLAGQLGIANDMRFAGFIPEDDLPACYQAADLFVLPTQALEGFGLITLEALASGLPVVGTPVGGTPEILGQFDSRLLTTGPDAAALADGIGRGLTLVRAEGSALAERCRAFALRYDWERIVDQYEALYAELVESAQTNVQSR
jgi:glycosyltransferase involved in cell wall biosynthesis